jgi:hypothetical protein
MNLESGCRTVSALTHDPCDRAAIGNDEIGHITEADNAGVYEALNSRDRKQGASGGDVDDHDVCASRIDRMRAVRVGDDRSGRHNVIDRVWAELAGSGERYGAAAA